MENVSQTNANIVYNLIHYLRGFHSRCIREQPQMPTAFVPSYLLFELREGDGGSIRFVA